MRRQLAVGLLAICAANAAWADDDDKLVIDKFHFTWTVAEVGSTHFLIEKDEKSTKAGLRYGVGTISMTLEDAEAVGVALARTDEFVEKLKGTKDQIETIKTGKIHVDFKTTDKGEFLVQVTPEKWMRVFATLKQKEANALAGPMKKAVRAGALADRKLKL